MFFTHTLEKLVSGEKTQTRRIHKGEIVSSYIAGTFKPETVSLNGRKKWKVGQTYAVCPKRGHKQVGRIRILAIDYGRLRDITEAAARAEGFSGIDEFRQAWDTINNRKGQRWDDNPLVWVLELANYKAAESK